MDDRVELLAFLEFALAASLDHHDNRFSRTYPENLFKMYYGWARGAGLPIRGSTFLELGCEVLSVTPYRRVPVDDALQATFVEPFRSAPREEVEVAGAMVYLRKT